jgi:hypothetical protein
MTLLVLTIAVFVVGSAFGMFLREIREALESSILLDIPITIEVVDDKPDRLTRWILNK